MNISNPADLRRLKDCFPGKEVYLVVGSDVVEHASAYRHPVQADSVHHFPHIIFMRNHEARQKDFRKRLEGRLAGISGEEGWGEKLKTTPFWFFVEDETSARSLAKTTSEGIIAAGGQAWVEVKEGTTHKTVGQQVTDRMGVGGYGIYNWLVSVRKIR